jgi:excisionase family DNA binding protein
VTDSPNRFAERLAITVDDAASIDIPRLVSGQRIAECLGITERHVKRLVAERRIPFVKVGRFIRFDTEAIARWIAASSVESRR